MICFVADTVWLKHLQVNPENGLEVKVSGSGATGSYPTTLSPSMLMIDWRCRMLFYFCFLNNLSIFITLILSRTGYVARDIPYEVNVTIPVADYEPVSFFLTKMCGENLSFWRNISPNQSLNWSCCKNCIFFYPWNKILFF